MESKLKGTVNHLQFVDSTFDAAKHNEYLQDRHYSYLTTAVSSLRHIDYNSIVTTTVYSL